MPLSKPLSSAATTHALFGASSAHRWFHCPGSVRLCADLPDTPTIYSAEGTAAHELAARCLSDADDAETYLGAHINLAKRYRVELLNRLNIPHVFEVTPDMAAAVQTYLDAVRSKLVEPDDEFEVERQFKISHISDDLFGTNDALVYSPSTTTLYIFDFKYGAGVFVPVLENLQLLYYALGATVAFGNRGISKIVMTIVQPRIGDEDDHVRSYEVDAVTLLEWGADLTDAYTRAAAPDAPLIPGPHCKTSFCKAAAICPALTGLAEEAANREFEFAVGALSADELGKELARADLLDLRSKALRKLAFEEGKAGRVPTGFKFVAKVARRKWTEEGTVKSTLTKAGHNLDAVLKLATPSQVEKTMGKAAYALVAEHVSQLSSGVNLVPVSNKKPAVAVSADAHFEDISD